MKVQTGQIWYVISDFWTSGDDNEIQGRSAKVKIKKGEKIEIRYPYKWHFRTEDNLYCHVEESVLIKNCLLFGVKNKNSKQSLADILLNSEYTPIN